jgi:hypothetical protein
MDVQKYSAEQTQSGQFSGCLKLLNEDEKGHNLLASFIEQAWMRQVGVDFDVSFKPTIDAAFLVVTGTSAERVDDVLSWALDTLKEGFSNQGALLVETSLSI